MPEMTPTPSAGFPVGIIHYAAPPVPGGVEKVVAEQAGAIVRAGYPVRLVVGAGSEAPEGVDLRRVPELASDHPRTIEAARLLGKGMVPDDFEERVIGLAQALSRELVGCGTVFVHNCLTMPLSPVEETPDCRK